MLLNVDVQDQCAIGEKKSQLHVVTDSDGKLVLTLDQCDWADWDKSGDLLFARGGKIFRLRASGKYPFASDEAAVQLIDLNNSKFEEIAPTAAATRW